MKKAGEIRLFFYGENGIENAIFMGFSCNLIFYIKKLILILSSGGCNMKTDKE